MTITLGHAIAAVLASVALLLGIACLFVRSTKTVYPVRCVHCRMYRKMDTIISHSEKKNQWGICSDCVRHYWHFSEDDEENRAVG
jgi:hypothetical protein